MATISGFGFSGVDHPNTLFETWLGRKNAEWNSALNFEYQKKYAQWEAENGPSLRRKGLESAGYNPLLAVSGATNPLSGSSPNSGYDPNVSFGNTGMTDSSALANFVDSVKQKKIQTLQMEAVKDQTEAQTDAIRADVKQKEAQTKAIEKNVTSQRIQAISGSVGSAVGLLGLSYGITKDIEKSHRYARYARYLAPVSAVAPSAFSLGSSALGSLGALGVGGLLAVPAGVMMKKAQDEARKEGRTSFTKHMSAGW